MVTANFIASKFIDNILINCRVKFNNIKKSYSTKTLIAIGNERSGARNLTAFR